MGLWDQFVVVKTEVSGFAVPLEVLSRHDGWLYARLPWVDGSMADAVVPKLAAVTDAPVIGAYVADSDAACIYFADGTGLAGELSINDALGDDSGSDGAEDEHTLQWIDADLHRRAAAALVEWARRHAPSQPSAADIVSTLADLEDDELGEELGHRQLVFAEDGVRAVFELLGFASLDDAVFLVGDGP